MKPIFLISLPRSGSTLLQRILMGHSQISSKTESWLMLPLVYMLRKEGMLSEYNQRDAHYALTDFIKELPNSRQDYIQALHDFAISLYTKQSNGSIYFLEKTPRYYLIAKELREIFPEGKFIFLVRDPIQTIASIITTFKLKNVHFYLIDLIKGFSHMATAIETLNECAYILKYEDIVTNHEETVDKLMTYLELHPVGQLADNLNDRGLKGRFGDKKGTYQYQKIEDVSMNKWRSTFHDIVLKKFALQIIKGISPRTLEIYGYNKAALVEELQKVHATFTSDSLKSLQLLITSHLIKTFNLNLYRKRIRDWSKEIVIN